MVDFTKLILGDEPAKLENPIDIYDNLDRASDKGPLRPAQISVLTQWFEERRQDKDVIIKLHTGQGKTLIGLLILTARMNSSARPSLYLCPNNYLVDQTAQQAQQFGIKYCLSDGELPNEFLDGKSVLITSVQKLFNGLSKFKLGTRSEDVGSIVLDDSHACLDAIRACFTIKLSQGTPPYQEFLTLFGQALSEQGEGAFQDIKNKVADEFLPVPYWAWQSHSTEVASILSKYADRKEIKFTWPLLKNILPNCLCLLSGSGLEIVPYQLPLSLFGSFSNATQRIYMSATVNNDAFFVKDLGVAPEVVKNPIRYSKEKWSGERMVLIPSLIHDDLNREVVVNRFAKPIAGRSYGLVALTSSFELAKLWETLGAKVAKSETINSDIKSLKSGKWEAAVVFVNRYDGIDLPDNSCRILIMDSRPFSDELLDRYYEQCRGNSEIIDAKLAQNIEQGMGRHIRGEKDFGVVILIGPQLVKAVSSKKSKRFLSAQTRQQLDLGKTIAGLARADREPADPMTLIDDLIAQCLSRNEGWKSFFKRSMDKMPDEEMHERVLDIFVAERRAESHYVAGEHSQSRSGKLLSPWSRL